MPIKRRIYTSLSEYIIEAVKGVVYVSRYRKQFDNPEADTEFSQGVWIEIEELNFEEGKGRQRKASGTLNFYVSYANYAQDHRTQNADSRTLDESLDDYDFEECIINALDKIYSKKENLDGLKSLEVKQSSEFLNTDALIVFKIVCEIETCEFKAECNC
ncbi:hypothetical protein V9L05_20505 [Bernardetia sp. Wsw4-3y2]|uniref:hypothetical protein n=1 Tax=Bernardetia sp. Wsw4-3y2 TaxID=3127471 RepID=UPI0030D5F820